MNSEQAKADADLVFSQFYKIAKSYDGAAAMEDLGDKLASARETLHVDLTYKQAMLLEAIYQFATLMHAAVHLKGRE